MKRPTVFLSHPHKDAKFALDLRTRLDADGINAWLDAVEIKVGDTIHEKVNENLRRSDFFAIVLSITSVNSRCVQDELSSASGLEKYSKKGVFLLPILLEECDVPPLLLDRRYANFVRDPESAYRELVDAIRTHYQRQSTASEVLLLLGVDGLTKPLIEAFAEDASRFAELAARQFEELVAGLPGHFGYKVELTSYSRDGGYDVLATRSILPPFTPESMLVVCKRYRRDHKLAQCRFVSFWEQWSWVNGSHGAFGHFLIRHT